MASSGNLTRPRLRIESIHSFSCQALERSYFFPGEAHPALELIYVCRGTVHCVVCGRDMVLKQGDLALVGPDQWHMLYADPKDAPQIATGLFSLAGRELSPLYHRAFHLEPSADALVQQLLGELNTPDDYTDDVIASLLSHLLLTLLRQSDPQGDAPLSGEHRIILRTQQYICAHSRDRLSVPLVAQTVDMSPSYLTALFSKHLHISPGEYIRRVKLEESKRMIRENTLNFTEIASTLQYSTVHHFSRQFKEKFGITPTEYAKSLR